MGADDYVVKPFSVRELVMRVRALARRTAERRVEPTVIAESRTLRWRGLEVDPLRHRVLLDGAERPLRPLEFRLIQLLLENPGRVFTRAKLLEEVWGVSAGANTRTVDTHVRRLRERLGAYGTAVETVHGFGYRVKELT
jgi:two-component system phosphate regulon response regulator PhoB